MLSEAEPLLPCAVTARLLDIVTPDVRLQNSDDVEVHFVDAAAL